MYSSGSKKQKIGILVLLASSVSYAAVTFACGFALALFIPMMSSLNRMFLLFLSNKAFNVNSSIDFLVWIVGPVVGLYFVD
jgi:hypothetical protein